jgi:hypothetical protein
MSDIPPLLETPVHRRHWLEYVATAAALLLSAVSLWVAIGTMDANRKMVAAASWPFLQLDTSNGDAAGHDVISFSVTNAGVGPAVVETFELSWHGIPMHSGQELLEHCCGYKQGQIVWSTGTVAVGVIRTGETRMFITYPKGPKNAATYDAFNFTRLKGLSYSACFCSVFGECWLSDLRDLHPPRIDKCPAAEVPYAN